MLPWLWMVPRGLRPQSLESIQLRRCCTPIIPSPWHVGCHEPLLHRVEHSLARLLQIALARPARKNERPMRQQQRATVGSHGQQPKDNDSVTFVCYHRGGDCFGTKKTAPKRCLKGRNPSAVGWGERSDAQQSPPASPQKRWASLRSPQPTRGLPEAGKEVFRAQRSVRSTAIALL